MPYHHLRSMERGQIQGLDVVGDYAYVAAGGGFALFPKAVSGAISALGL